MVRPFRNQGLPKRVTKGYKTPDGGTTLSNGQGTPHPVTYSSLRPQYRHEDLDWPQHRNVGKHICTTLLSSWGPYTSTSSITVGSVLREIVTRDKSFIGTHHRRTQKPSPRSHTQERDPVTSVHLRSVEGSDPKSGHSWHSGRISILTTFLTSRGGWMENGRYPSGEPRRGYDESTKRRDRYDGSVIRPQNSEETT